MQTESIRQRLADYIFRLVSESRTNNAHKDLGEIQMGPGSIVKPPRKLQGARYISIGVRSSIGEGSWLAAYDEYAGIQYRPQLIIGDNVSIGDFACITCIDKVAVGDGCLMSEYVYISDHVHGYDPRGGQLVRQPLTSKGPVLIGANTFVGYRVSILPGVSIGEYCVVGANSVVTKSCPDYCMLAGVPAKVIKRYSHDLQSWLSIDDYLQAASEYLK